MHWLWLFCNLNSPKIFTCKLRTEFSSRQQRNPLAPSCQTWLSLHTVWFYQHEATKARWCLIMHKPAVHAYFGLAKACSCSYCCSRHLWFYDRGRLASSLREFQRGAFASKNIRAPEENAWSRMGPCTRKCTLSFNASSGFSVSNVC